MSFHISIIKCYYRVWNYGIKFAAGLKKMFGINKIIKCAAKITGLNLQQKLQD